MTTSANAFPPACHDHDPRLAHRHHSDAHVIYMVSGFENALRLVYIDGRKHLDPDVVVPTYNGESIGTWEGDSLSSKPPP